jgi:hypothetical protein
LGVSGFLGGTRRYLYDAQCSVQSIDRELLPRAVSTRRGSDVATQTPRHRRGGGDAFHTRWVCDLLQSAVRVGQCDWLISSRRTCPPLCGLHQGWGSVNGACGVLGGWNCLDSYLWVEPSAPGPYSLNPDDFRIIRPTRQVPAVSSSFPIVCCPIG